jgi:hypothetical protein
MGRWSWLWKKADWASPREQARNQHFSVVSDLGPASRFPLWLPSMMDYKLQERINSFFSKLLLVSVLSQRPHSKLEQLSHVLHTHQHRHTHTQRKKRRKRKGREREIWCLAYICSMAPSQNRTLCVSDTTGLHITIWGLINTLDGWRAGTHNGQWVSCMSLSSPINSGMSRAPVHREILAP